MSYSINEAFKDLRRKRNLNEDNEYDTTKQGPSWANRIQKLIDVGFLSPATVEEWISEYEEEYAEFLANPDLTVLDKRYHFSQQIKDEFGRYNDWIRTDMFEVPELQDLNASVFEEILDDSCYKLGFGEFFRDSDGSMILMKGNGRRNWLRDCNFKNLEDAKKYYDECPVTNIDRESFIDSVANVLDLDDDINYD